MSEKVMTREYRYDLIRMVAIMFVICIHSMGIIADYEGANRVVIFVRAMYEGIIYTGVPLFVLLSGALLLGRDEPIGVFFRKRLRRLLVPFVLWSAVVFAILYVQEGGRNLLEWLVLYVKKSFTEGVYGIYWYVYLILGLYLITPGLRRMCDNRHLAVYMSVLAFALYYVSRLYAPFALTTWFSCGILLWIGYFIMGYVVARYLYDNEWFNRICNVLLVVAFVANVVVCYLDVSPLAEELLVPILAVCLFNTFLHIKEGKDSEPLRCNLRWRSIVTYVSSISYGVYLTHFMFISILVKFSFVKQIPLAIEPLAMVAMVAVLECVMMGVVKKVRLDKYLM